jgi:hypothetical protein
METNITFDILKLYNEFKDVFHYLVEAILILDNSKEISSWILTKYDRVNYKLAFYIGSVVFFKLNDKPKEFEQIFIYDDKVTLTQLNTAFKVSEQLQTPLEFDNIIEKIEKVETNEDKFYLFLFNTLLFMNWIIQNDTELSKEIIQNKIKYLLGDQSCFSDNNFIQFFPTVCEYYLKS